MTVYNYTIYWLLHTYITNKPPGGDMYIITVLITYTLVHNSN